VHTVIYARTQRVYSFSAIVISIQLQYAKIIKESHCVGLFETWFSNLQSLESGKVNKTIGK
jgi:hypothetical protein